MPKHVVVIYAINYTYLYHHIVVLDRYTNSNLVYYKHNGDDGPYDFRKRFSDADDIEYKELVKKPKHVKQLKEHINLSRISL